ncbi:MAG: ABC transporter permease [Paracoccaceae bacterium]|nr:ABC transporter permease [Paracoccaceae bacterium]
MSVDGPVLAADGTPLKRSLAKALRREKFRAFMLVAPLLVFILITFVAPIADMLFRSVENSIVRDTIPRTVQALRTWDPEASELPPEATFSAFYTDMVFAEERKQHTRLGTRLNYEKTGISSLFRKSGRRVGRFDTDEYAKAFADLNAAWEDTATFEGLVGNAALPETASAYATWRAVILEDDKDPASEAPWDVVYNALYRDLMQAQSVELTDAMLAEAQAAVATWEPVSISEALIDVDEDWADPEVWKTIQTYAASYTPGYFLNSADLQLTPDGIESRPENERIYITLFQRTLFMSLVITFSTILLGYPVAWLLANLPARHANVLLILVLLPFWTSLLVRTSSWKVLLQQQGVINDLLVWIGLIDDAGRLVMINNQTGTIIAMTHILLPFMILPLYSVMKTIPPSYLRAAKSLGATNWTAFWRVYFPNSVPGIGAGSILVFILAIGYYITPELVGGTQGVFISNRIAYHISSSLNWGLAAALGTVLLAAVLLLYYAYDKVVGIDNVKLGG